MARFSADAELVFHWECHTYIGDHLLPRSWSTWPEIPVTREQVDKMLHRTKKIESLTEED